MGKSRRKKRNKQVTSYVMEQGPTKESRTASSQQNKKEQSRRKTYKTKTTTCVG